MSKRIQISSRVKVKQTINLRRTIKLVAVGSSSAALICLLLFIGFDSKTGTVKAGSHNVNEDTSRFATKRLFDSNDSVVKYNSKEAAADSMYTLRKQKTALKQDRKIRREAEAITDETTGDFINLYPKNTSGVFNIEFNMPGKESFTPKIELLDRLGKVLETKISTPENGRVIESFIMDNNLPDGQYLVKVYINKELFVRQVVLQKEVM